MANACLSSDLRDVGRPSCGQRSASGPHQLQSRGNRHHRDGRLQSVCSNFPSQQAPQHDSRYATYKKLEKYWRADGAKTPVKSAAYHSQYQPKKKIRSNNLCRSHLGIVQQKNGSQRSSACGRKSGFHSDRKSEPRKPAVVFSSERGVLYPFDKCHTRRGRKEYTEQNNYNWTPRISIQKAQRPSARKQAWNCSLQQKPKVTCMNLLPYQIERRRKQTQYTGKQEGCSHRFPCCKSGEQQ